MWIMLHSGSRGPGNKIGTYFIELAKKEMKRWFIISAGRRPCVFSGGCTALCRLCARGVVGTVLRPCQSRNHDGGGRRRIAQAVAGSRYQRDRRQLPPPITSPRSATSAKTCGSLARVPCVPGKTNSESFQARWRQILHRARAWQPAIGSKPARMARGRAMSRTEAKKRFSVEGPCPRNRRRGVPQGCRA